MCEPYMIDQMSEDELRTELREQLSRIGTITTERDRSTRKCLEIDEQLVDAESQLSDCVKNVEYMEECNLALQSRLDATEKAWQESDAACAELETRLGKANERIAGMENVSLKMHEDLMAAETRLGAIREYAEEFPENEEPMASVRRMASDVEKHMEGPQRGDSSRKSDSQGLGDTRSPSASDSEGQESE